VKLPNKISLLAIQTNLDLGVKDERNEKLIKSRKESDIDKNS